MKIGNVSINGKAVLGPMAGVTDLPFRLICKDFGCSLGFTEMISAKGMFYENKNTQELLKSNERERPVAVQLFGSDPIILKNMALKVEKLDIDIIDINMGCPVPKIVKNGEGSALMKNPKLIGEIVKTVSSAISKPLTIKIRKGFDSTCINAVEIAKIAEDNGAKAITVHGRTREEYYTGKADWDIIGKVKESINIPVIGSGDIIDPISAKYALENYKCDALMIARGSRGNPWIFRDINHYLETGEILESPTIKEKITLALRHGKMLIEYKGEYIGIREMRKHIGWYLKGIHGASNIKVEVNKAQNYEELENILLSLIN